MNTIELGKELRKMYINAANREQVAMIHLFGIKYSKELKNCKVSEVVDEAGLRKSYGTEVRKGMRLARYVDLK